MIQQMFTLWSISVNYLSHMHMYSLIDSSEFCTIFMFVEKRYVLRMKFKLSNEKMVGQPYNWNSCKKLQYNIKKFLIFMLIYISI